MGEWVGKRVDLELKTYFYDIERCDAEAVQRIIPKKKNKKINMLDIVLRRWDMSVHLFSLSLVCSRGD